MKNSLSEKRLLPYTAVFSVLLALLVLLLIPIFLLAGYAVPAADDFSFSCETHAAYQSGRGILAMIAAAAGKTAEVYESWQGTFSAVFLMAFQPSVWGFRFYSLTTWIMVISLVSGIFLICFRVFSGVFGAAKSLSGIIAAVIAAACTQFLPSPNQGFFWYNGSVYYTFTFGLVLWFFSILIAWLQRGESWRVALLSLLGIVIGGNNYVMALLTVILMSVILLGLLICKNTSAKGLLIPFVFLLAAFAVSASAPGNAVRQSAFAEHPGPIRAILLSFRYALHGIRRWSDLRLLACLLLLAPFLWNAASGSSREHTFRLPGAVTAFSFCLLASMFTPHVYAIGFDGPGRLQNIYFYAYVLLLVFNLFWWCGWVGRRISKNAGAPLSGIRVLPFLFFSASAVLCMACSLFLFRGSLTSAAALGELRSGEAQAYYSQAMERQTILEDPAVQDCVFTPFRENPWLLYFGDMTDDPHSYENEDTATFYGKHSIVVKTPDSPNGLPGQGSDQRITILSKEDMLLPMKESKRKRYCQGLFAFLVIAITLSGLLRTAFWPKDVNTYESRNANKPAAFTVGNYLSGVFQDSMEKALADQVPFAQYFKKAFNILRFQYYRFMLLPKAERHPELCFHYKGIGLIDGYMVHKPADLSENTEIMLSLAHKRTDDIRACREINPETEYYLFYIESDRDYDFETAEKKDTYGFITENMGIPADRTGRLCVDNLEDYKKIYFKTDHHWNCYGAYEGYRGLMTLLGVEEKLLEPVETASDPLWWAGSKAAEVGFREYKEPFPICRYEYPPMEIIINGSPSDMLEPQEAFFSGDMDSISYGDYYGGIEGEVILDTNRPERKNILLLGDSFDNAIRKLVASHFNKTFSVDERTYEEDRGEPFVLAEYVRKNDIDIVVYDGDILAFSGDAFL